MLKRALIFLVFLVGFTPMTMAQSQEIILQAEKIVNAYEALNLEKTRSEYLRFAMINEYVGPVQLKPVGVADNVAKVYAQMGITPPSSEYEITDETRGRFRKMKKYLNHRLFKGKQKATVKKAVTYIGELEKFAKNLPPAKVQQYTQTVMVYTMQADQYSIRRSLYNGVGGWHLPLEFLRFGAALTLVRLTTCFGDSIGGAIKAGMSFETPSMIRARPKDPACVTEIAQMLTDPLFYAGFSAFVIGNRISAPVMNKALRAINPGRGRAHAALSRHLVPNLAMAIGFLSDHTVKTLLSEKSIGKCLATKVFGEEVLEAGKSSEENTSPSSYLNATLERSENGDEIYSVEFKSSECSKAMSFLNSDQFVGEEVVMGVSGLLAAAVILAQSSAILRTAFTKGAPLVSRMGPTAAKIVSKGRGLTMMFTAGGPAGFVLSLGHMYFFLLIDEWIRPLAMQGYHTLHVEPRTEGQQDRFVKAYLDFEPNNVQLLEEESCFDYYHGKDEAGVTETCTSIPILAELASYADFSRTWREKKVLGEFNQFHHHWMIRLNSFFNNYFSSREVLSRLARSREVNRTGSSELNKAKITKIKNEIMEIIRKSFPPYDPEQKYKEFEAEFLAHKANNGYISPLNEMPFESPEAQIWNRLDAIYYVEIETEYHSDNDLAWQLGGAERRASEEEFDEIVETIKGFIDMGPIVVENPSWMNSLVLQTRTQKDLIPYAKEYDTMVVKDLLESDSDEDKALGMFLFKEWIPYMYGQKDRIRNSRLHPKVNERGMPEEQYALWQDLWPELKDFDPTFRGESIFIDLSYEPVGLQTKTEVDAQWNEGIRGFDADEAYSHALVRMMCGASSSVIESWFGDDSGLHMEFQFPHIVDHNACNDLYMPIFSVDLHRRHSTRSLFQTPEGIQIGLHNYYINTNQDHPLVFDTEEAAGTWWNETVKWDSIERLDKMEKEYNELAPEYLRPLIDSVETADKGFSALLRSRFRPGSVERKFEKRGSFMNSLLLSLQNQFYHYQQLIKLLLPSSKYYEILSDIEMVDRCFVDLLNSIPDKNYRVYKTRCNEAKNNVKNALKFGYEEYGGYLKSHIQLIDVERLKKEENMPAAIKGIIAEALAEEIDAIFEEMHQLNLAMNETFNFKLNEGEKQ